LSSRRPAGVRKGFLIVTAVSVAVIVAAWHLIPAAYDGFGRWIMEPKLRRMKIAPPPSILCGVERGRVRGQAVNSRKV
jgi:hypothetical protein